MGKIQKHCGKTMTKMKNAYKNSIIKQGLLYSTAAMATDLDGAMMPLVERMVFLHISIHLECWGQAHRCGSSPPGPQHTGRAARAGGRGASGAGKNGLYIQLCYCIHQLQPHGHPGEPLGDGRDVAAVELVRGVDAVAVPLRPVHQVLNSRNVSTKFFTPFIDKCSSGHPIPRTL